MLQVYKKGNSNYKMNGDLQPETISAESDIRLNDTWEMTAVFPATPEYTEYVTEDAVIKVRMPEFDKNQLWYVYKTAKTDDEITAYLRPVFMQAAEDCILLDVRPTTKSGQEALDIMCAQNARYSGRSDITAVKTAYYYHKNLIEAIQGEDENSFLNRWGGEVLYDNYEVIVNERVGGEYGARAEMGYNIDGVEETCDVQDVITRIFPIGFNGRMLTGTQYIDSSNIQKYPFVHARFITYEDVKYVADVDNEEERAAAYQTIAEFEAELRRRVQMEYDAGVDLPKITYVINFVELSKTTEYQDIKDLVSVGFGDTVRVRHRTLGIDTTARCIGRKYDHVLDMITEITLGDFSGSYLSDMGSVMYAAANVIDVKSNTVMADRVAGILNAMNTQLKYQKNISQTADVRAVLFEDRIEGSPTYGAMCMGTQGLQIAKERTQDNKDWKWTTAITADGINAMAVVTGILSDKLGKNYWNLDTGEFRLSAETQVGDETVQKIAEDAVEGQTQEDIFNKLTDNGTLPGIFMKDDQLYVSASYILSGTLRLGGLNNEHGRLEIVNENNEIVGTMDKDGSRLLTGKFVNIKDAKKVELDAGMLRFYENEETIGNFDVTSWAGTEPKEYGMSLHANNKFLAVGCGYTSSGLRKADMLINNGLNPNGYTEKVITYGSLRTVGSVILNSYIRLASDTGEFVKIKFGNGESTCIRYSGDGKDKYISIVPGGNWNGVGCTIESGLGVANDLRVLGQKNRLVKTKNYGNVKMNAFETSEAYFADIGSGTVSENRCVTVFFDPVYAETIDYDAEYHVFVTPSGRGKIEYVKKELGRFTVYGEPEATFDWMVCAKQCDYAALRMENEKDFPKKEIEFDERIFEHDADAQKIVESAVFDYEKEVNLL